MAHSLIVFDTKSVEMILRGRKLQTRRVITPPVLTGPDDVLQLTLGRGEAVPMAWIDHALNGSEVVQLPKPRYFPWRGPGAILHVAESWAEQDGEILYAADYIHGRKPVGVLFKSPRFMPHHCARISLRVVSVRVERLHEISEDDAMEELGQVGLATGRARDVFIARWDDINRERGYGWSANPWVWAIRFEVVK